ncbi:hypothetical protein [Spirosoma linguale]|uniref:Uncharacterized protein n=1 Tax=Spirosoma linguale (strain ATCC 33905 / DSM 74 / LMG 10896 / Claus 1) TaxID=504472 RepID=D2QSJ1_SPILD|nr:hypothetical protein Slin_5808 [Spirosoma linguale DSM 74]
MSVICGQIITGFSIVLTCFGCNSSQQELIKPTFFKLECSYDGGWDGDDVFSIIIDSTGRLLLSNNRWEPYQYYQGQLSLKDLHTLFLKVNDTRLCELKAHYRADSTPDKRYYNIWVTALTHKLQKVQAYGDSVPQKLESLRLSICLIRDTTSLTPINHKVIFATRAALYPTPSNLPVTIKFLPGVKPQSLEKFRVK